MTRRTWPGLVVPGAAGLLLASCGVTSTQATGASAPASSTSSASATTGSGSTGAVPAGEVWLGYERTGGLAGVQDEVLVTPSGEVTVSSRTGGIRRFRLTPAELDRLRELAARVDPAASPLARPSSGQVADAFEVTLTVAGRRVRLPEREAPANQAALAGALAALQRHS